LREKLRKKKRALEYERALLAMTANRLCEPNLAAAPPQATVRGSIPAASSVTSTLPWKGSRPFGPTSIWASGSAWARTRAWGSGDTNCSRSAETTQAWRNRRAPRPTESFGSAPGSETVWRARHRHRRVTSGSPETAQYDWGHRDQSGMRRTGHPVARGRRTRPEGSQSRHWYRPPDQSKWPCSL